MLKQVYLPVETQHVPRPFNLLFGSGLKELPDPGGYDITTGQLVAPRLIQARLHVIHNMGFHSMTSFRLNHTTKTVLCLSEAGVTGVTLRHCQSPEPVRTSTCKHGEWRVTA